MKKSSSGRKALQPRNIFPVSTATDSLKKPKPQLAVSEEKLVQTIDASLAEELTAFKKKLERLRKDRESTERLLKERDAVMDLQMTHLIGRGEIQKTLEIQVDRLFRLKELHAYSSKISPIRSLRVKEEEKRKRLSFEPMADADADAEEQPPQEEEESSDKTNLDPSWAIDHDQTL